MSSGALKSYLQTICLQIISILTTSTCKKLPTLISASSISIVNGTSVIKEPL